MQYGTVADAAWLCAEMALPCPAYSRQPKIEDDVEKLRSAEQHLGEDARRKRNNDVAHTPSTSASSSIGCRAVRPVQCVCSS